jgi:hypothetical protein
MAAAELVVAFLSSAPAVLLPALLEAKLLETASRLFFAADANGGGRQDFLRHVLLRAFAAALQTNAPDVLGTLLTAGCLVRRLLEPHPSNRSSAASHLSMSHLCVIGGSCRCRSRVCTRR